MLTEEQKKAVYDIIENKYGSVVRNKMENRFKKVVQSRFLDSEEVDENEILNSTKSKLDFNFVTHLLDDINDLDGFDIFDKDLGLQGDAYKVLKRALWYYQHSLRQDTVHYKINSKTKVDNRSHLLIITGPGTGKTTIKNQNHRVLKGFPELDGVCEVSGISHPEQLVGKIVYEGKGQNKIPVEKYGYLGYKCFMNDESQDMLNERNDIYAKAQRLKRLAMDTYMENKISKKLVSDSPKDVLEYHSPTRICDFAHPTKLDSAFFDTGSFRRYFAFNIEHDPNIDIDDITEFKLDEEKKNEVSWVDYLDELYENQIVDVKFNELSMKIIAHFHKCLLNYLLNHKNPNAFRYGLQTRYSLRGLFCKYLLILCKARKEREPTFKTILDACSDVLLFTLKSIETYNKLGNMGISSDVWNGLGESDSQVLEYMLKSKCLSKKSSYISIKKFQSILAHFYGCKVTQARAHYYRLKKDGYIDSAQDGQYGSKVWLTYIPTQYNINIKEDDSKNFWKEVFQGVGDVSGYKTYLKTLNSVGKDIEKTQGVGGVGVLGCVLVKKVLCVEVHIDKNKNKNIYTNMVGQNPEPPTPCPKKKTLSSIKQGSQGVKTLKNRPTPSKNPKSDRELQFYEAPECKTIKNNLTKEQVLQYFKQNPTHKVKDAYKKLGTGTYKWYSELKKEKKI